MSPLNKRILRKKKGGSPIIKYLFAIIFLAAVIFLLFYYKFDNRTIYERTLGFFKSEIEKSPSVTIIGSDKEIKSNRNKGTTEKEKTETHQKSSPKPLEEKDEIEEVIKKKLDTK